MNENINKLEVASRGLFILCDGDYWLPVCSSEIYINVSDIYPNGFWNNQKRVFGTGKQSLNICFEYDFSEEEKDRQEVWIAVFRVGQPIPLWGDVIKLDEYKLFVDIHAEMVLDTGLHFIVISHARLDNKIEQYENMIENAIQLPYGIRYDFIVESDGSSLIHPEIRKIQFTPRPLSEWKKMVKEHYIEGITLNAQLDFQKPYDLTNNYLQIEIFDESLNWIAWSDYASDEGHINVFGFYPILDGEYKFVVLHNQTPIFYGEFICSDGICILKQMKEWVNDKILNDVLKSRSHANDLKFNSTSYGRCLQLLEDIMVWRDDESCLEGDYLEKLLANEVSSC